MRVFCLLCAAIALIANTPAMAVDRADALRRLGSHLFSDKRLSTTNAISCASCHQPEKAFADGIPLARGKNDAFGMRNAPGLGAIADQRAFFWDGRVASLEEAVIDPLLTEGEHGFRSETEVLERLRSFKDYDEPWKSAFAISLEKADISQLAAALAAFVKSQTEKESPYEVSLRSTLPEHALPPAALRGQRLFAGSAGCDTCHALGARPNQMVEEKYHALGIGLGEHTRSLPKLTAAIEHLPLQTRLARMKSDPDLAALGRYVVTLDPADIGRFRSPSLYDVAVTAPYMHDGSVASLRDAVEYEVYYHNGKATPITPEDVDDIVAFLRTLTRTSKHDHTADVRTASKK